MDFKRQEASCFRLNQLVNIQIVNIGWCLTIYRHLQCKHLQLRLSLASEERNEFCWEQIKSPEGWTWLMHQRNHASKGLSPSDCKLFIDPCTAAAGSCWNQLRTSHGWNWLCGTQRKLLAAPHRSHSLYSPLCQNLPMQTHHSGKERFGCPVGF